MSALAPTLQAFFTDRLIQQRHASPHTVAAYRDGWRRLIRFAATHLAKAPSQLELGDLDAPSSAGSWPTSNTTTRTPCAPATRGCPPSMPCSAMPH